MSAAELLDRLDGVRKVGRDRWTASCPAHEDRAPSLSVRELDDGRVLAHCFSGCSVEDVLRAVDLDFEALFPESALGDRQPRVRRPFSARDLVEALQFELTVALVTLADVAADRPVDRTRCHVASERIAQFLEELRHAG